MRISDLTQVGSFENRGSFLYWAGIEYKKQLLDMRQELVENLRKNGIEIETQKFVPHITLVRQARTAIPEEKALLSEPFFTKVEKISLMCSERKRGALVYTELFSR